MLYAPKTEATQQPILSGKLEVQPLRLSRTLVDAHWNLASHLVLPRFWNLTYDV